MCVGGIRRSTIATSGVCSPTAAIRLVGGARLADDVEARLAEQHRDAFAQEHRVVGQHYAHGISALSRVPPAGGLQTFRRPSSASTRSASPRSPEPPLGVGAALAVVGDLDDQGAVLAHDVDLRRSPPRRTWRRSSGPRRPGSRRRPRPARAGARRGRRRASTRTGARAASDSSATGRPWSDRIAGWMPRAMLRSSSSDVVELLAGGLEQLRLGRCRPAAVLDQRAGRSRSRRAAAGRRRGGRARACGARCRRPRRSAPATPAGRSAAPAGRPAGARSRARSRPRR